jgi:hypothetical protein
MHGLNIYAVLSKEFVLEPLTNRLEATSRVKTFRRAPGIYTYSGHGLASNQRYQAVNQAFAHSFILNIGLYRYVANLNLGI